MRLVLGRQDLSSSAVEGHLNLNAGAVIWAALVNNLAVHQPHPFLHSREADAVPQTCFRHLESASVVRDLQNDAVTVGFQRNDGSAGMAVLNDVLQPLLRDSIQAKC